MSLELVATPDGTITRLDRGIWLTPPFNIALGAAARNLLVALRAYLKTRPELAALTEVYLNRVARNPVYPYLVVNQIDKRPTLTTAEFYHEWVMLQFTVLSLSDVQAETLGVAAWHALTPRVSHPILLFADGTQIVRLPGPERGPEEQKGEGPKSASVWKYSFDYRFAVGREM